MTKRKLAASAATLTVGVAIVLFAALVAFAVVYHAGHAYAAP